MTLYTSQLTMHGCTAPQPNKHWLIRDCLLALMFASWDWKLLTQCNPLLLPLK